MFMFYPSKKFNLVACPFPRLVPHQNKPSLACAASLNKNFMDADMMRSLSCFLQWVVFASSPKNKNKEIIPILEPLEWVQNALVAGKKGGSGAVSTSLALDGRVQIIVKKAMSTDKSIERDFVHEYIVAVYGTNPLRAILPNFAYTLAIYQSKRVVRVAMENIPGLQMATYLKNTSTQPFSTASMNHFLKIWIQLVLALEIAQETLFFTHYDLHGQNVLLRPVQPPLPRLEFPIMDKIYCLESIDTLTTVIDYGHATIRYDQGFIGQKHGFPQFGMYPFYVPGADLFKMTAYLWIQVLEGKKFSAQSMGKRLQVFFKFLLDKFFQCTLSKNELTASFYNGTQLPSAFFSPYDMLQFMDQRRGEILGILGITDYPWTVSKISPTFKLYKTLIYRKKETYQCYQSLFCSAIEPMPRNLFHLTTRNTDTTLSSEEIKTIFGKKVPLLQRSEIPAMKAFLEPSQLWTRFHDRVEFLWTLMRKTGTPFSQDMTPYLYYYRAYVCVKGYVSYFSP
uniref:Protein kinase domain-containing protein n=1 Tax=viral metagenome TaxID=1070528 RepID=A0A6C0ICE7_9ZZZZ